MDYVSVFVEEEQVHSDSISIIGGDVNHIKNVLRMKTVKNKSEFKVGTGIFLSYIVNFG